MSESVAKPPDAMKPPHEVQAPLYQRLGDEFIALTPERWRRIRFTADMGSNCEGTSELACTITSDEGYGDVPAAVQRSVGHRLSTRRQAVCCSGRTMAETCSTSMCMCSSLSPSHRERDVLASWCTAGSVCSRHRRRSRFGAGRSCTINPSSRQA